MRRVVLIGAGGHAREVLEIVRSDPKSEPLEPLGFIDEDRGRDGELVSGLPVLGGFEWFDRAEAQGVVVICAVGAPEARKALVGKARARGLRFANAISALAHVSARARLGEGAMLFPHVVVSTDVEIGDHVILNAAATVSHDSRVGDYVTVNPGARLAGNVTVGEGCYLGMGSLVIQGRWIGEWSVIGAGAVVVRDIPAHVTAVGVPAQVMKERGKPN